MQIIDHAASWPENSTPGSYAMHAHYRELVEIWNSKVGRPLEKATIDTDAEELGVTMLVFRDSVNANTFLSMFSLHGMQEAKLNEEAYTWVRLRTKFAEKDVMRFFGVLDKQRCEMLALTNDWDAMRPSLNSVFAQSYRIGEGIMRAYDEITRARVTLGNKKEEVA